MKIQSNYYDIIDYLQDFTDDRIFLRRESMIKCRLQEWEDNFPKYIFEKCYDHQPNVEHINGVLSNPRCTYLYKEELEKYQKEMELTPIKASFHFLPNPEICIPLDLYLHKGNNITIKERKTSGFITKDAIFIGRGVDHDKALKDFFDKEFKSIAWKCSIKPVWYIVIQGVNEYHSKPQKISYDLSNENIWVNPPLAKIPNLMKYFKNYEDLYQQIETYVWMDIELDNPMKNIENDDRIIGHGFDLKSSFRKEKTK